MMNISSYSIIVLISIHNECMFSCSATLHNLVAVTRFEGINEYYKNIFGTPEFRQMGVRPIPHKKSYVRKLCKNIITSGYFRAGHEQWVEANYAGANVAANYDARYFANEYRRLAVLVDGEEKFEYLLTCFARKWELPSPKPYFISPPYNVNSAPSGSTITGRFIFEYNYENKLILSGLAEEPALSKFGNLTLDGIERAYIAEKTPLIEMGDRTECDETYQDPVCHLTPGEKLRLCTTVLSSRKFAKKVDFYPFLVNVQVECVHIEVSFRNEMWQKIDRKNVLFVEKAIGCKTINYNARGEQIIYFVSHGGGVNQIFVYKYRDDRVLVKDLMIGVSVVKY